MNKRKKQINFVLGDKENEIWQVASKDLIERRVFRSKAEIFESLIYFLQRAKKEEIIKFKEIVTISLKTMKENNVDPPVDFTFDVSKKSYTIIDNWLFRFDLTVYEKMVYIVLKRYAFEPLRIFPSHKTIAQSASISVQTVIRALANLQKKKLILVQSRQKTGQSNNYFLCDPSENHIPLPMEETARKQEAKGG